MPFVFMPYFGFGLFGAGGSGKVQPIFVGDVARYFAEALTTDAAIEQVYEVAGPDVMDWPKMHQIISTAVRGKPKRAIGVPSWYASLVASVVPASLLPFNKAQVQMAREDNVADNVAAQVAFDVELAPFEATVRSYASKL